VGKQTGLRGRAWGVSVVFAALVVVSMAAGAAGAKAPCTTRGCPVPTGDYKGPIFHLFVKKTRIEIVDTSSIGISLTCHERLGTVTFKDVPSLTPDWQISAKPPVIGRDSKYAKTTKTTSGGQTIKRTLNVTAHFTTSKRGKVTVLDHVVITTPGGSEDCHGSSTENVSFLRTA
jgi:hypothetical protein